MTGDRYNHVIQRALAQPWAVLPEKLALIQDLLAFRAAGGRLSAEEIQARIGAAEPGRAETRSVGRIAVVPIYGVISHRAFQASSGATSTEFVSAALRQALADEEVASIILDVSSPGGTVEGVPELAQEVFEAREVKPITAVANALMASAAYWIGSQASELVAIPSADVGSIGVYSVHEDWTGWLEKEGIQITTFKAGARKIEGAPWEPLDDDATAFMQSRVDDIYRDFVAAVARGRDVSAAEVRSSFGEGRVFGAKDARRLGMIDRVATFDQVVEGLAGRRRSRRARRAEDDMGVAVQVGAPQPGGADQATSQHQDLATADRDRLDLAVSVASRPPA